MPWYTVVGTYADNQQRYATLIGAPDADKAEQYAREDAESELIVAAVFDGDVVPVDTAPTRVDGSSGFPVR